MSSSSDVASSLSPSLALSSVESRLTFLEAKVGFYNPSTEKGNVTNRLESLRLQWKEKTPPSLRVSLDECERLTKDFHPGTSLSHQQHNHTSTHQQHNQQQHNSSLLYSRQEILASEDSIEQGTEQLHAVLDLLLKSATTSSPRKKSSSFEEQQVTGAPILAPAVISTTDEKRLDKALIQSVQLQNRTNALATCLDSLVENYHTIIRVMAEKTILAVEELEAIETRKGS